MTAQAADIPRARTSRRSLPGCRSVTVDHDQWREHFLNVTSAPHEAVPDAMARVAGLLRDCDAAVLAMTVFGSCAAYVDGVEALERSLGAVDWPVTWVEGADVNGRPVAGVQVHGITGRRLDTIRAGGRPVGRSFADQDAIYAAVADVRPPNGAAGRQEQAHQSFDALDAALRLAGLSFGDVVRTWLYVDRILDWYAELNAARSRFFVEHCVADSFAPASTGIGCANPHGLAMVAAAFAMRTWTGSRPAEPLRSPLQCPATSYGSAFSRAVESRVGGHRRVLVSGTAAIDPGGASACEGDAAGQVEVTLDVVGALLASRGLGWGDVSRAVAYFRRAADAAALERLAAAAPLRGLPLLVVQADVCRDELLFEIEVDAIA